MQHGHSTAHRREAHFFFGPCRMASRQGLVNCRLRTPRQQAGSSAALAAMGAQGAHVDHRVAGALVLPRIGCPNAVPVALQHVVRHVLPHALSGVLEAGRPKWQLGNSTHHEHIPNVDGDTALRRPARLRCSSCTGVGRPPGHCDRLHAGQREADPSKANPRQQACWARRASTGSQGDHSSPCAKSVVAFLPGHTCAQHTAAWCACPSAAYAPLRACQGTTGCAGQSTASVHVQAAPSAPPGLSRRPGETAVSLP